MLFADEPEHVRLLRVRDLLGMPIVGGSSNVQNNNLARIWGLAER